LQIARKKSAASLIESRLRGRDADQVPKFLVIAIWPQVEGIGGAIDKRGESLMFIGQPDDATHGRLVKIDRVECRRLASPGVGRSAQRTAANAIGLQTLRPERRTQAVKFDALLVLKFRLRFADAFNFSECRVIWRLVSRTPLSTISTANGCPEEFARHREEPARDLRPRSQGRPGTPSRA